MRVDQAPRRVPLPRLPINTAERYCRQVRDDQTATLFLLGTLQLTHLGPIDAALATESLPASRVTLDRVALDTLDTAAALALLRGVAAAGAAIEQLANFKASHARVIDVVHARLDQSIIEPVQRHRGVLAVIGAKAFELRDLAIGARRGRSNASRPIGGIPSIRARRSLLKVTAVTRSPIPEIDP